VGFRAAARERYRTIREAASLCVRRIVFEEPEHASPLVADFYRWWNEKRSIVGNRLLVESFIVMEPYGSVRTGSVPFWMVFNKQPSAQALETYLDANDPFDEIYMMLFSHGVKSIGLTPVEHWRRILRQARKEGAFIGVDESAYPCDFAVFARYHSDLKPKLHSRYPMPSPLTLNQLDDFLDQTHGRYAVQWL
jgi:hypothetical protein